MVTAEHPSLFLARFERPQDAVDRILELTRSEHPERFDDVAREVNEIATGLGELIRGMASACDAIVGDLYLRDIGDLRLSLFESSIRDTMARLYEQFPEARRA